VGDLRNILFIDSGSSRHMTRDKGCFSSLVLVVSKTYITFGDNGRERVLSKGEIKVSEKGRSQVYSSYSIAGVQLAFLCPSC
jgi:hypothetical protein